MKLAVKVVMKAEKNQQNNPIRQRQRARGKPVGGDQREGEELQTVTRIHKYC